MIRRQVECRVAPDTSSAEMQWRESRRSGINISDFDYPLPDERIAKFPLPDRDGSRLLVWRGGDISETTFSNLGSVLPSGSLLVFNDTRVVRARLVMQKPSGGRVEILCLEPHLPADYERAFAVKNSCEWICMVGGSRRWGEAVELVCKSDNIELRAVRAESGSKGGAEQVIRFMWDDDLTFGQILEQLGRVPIPPYLCRDSDQTDNTRYQTVYARYEGSVAAPTAGLHFTPGLIERLKNHSDGNGGIETETITLHVGAGTFLPVKVENALDHTMHTEHFEVSLGAVEHLISKAGRVIAVGTTSVRTLESLVGLGYRISNGNPELERPIGQFELDEIPEAFNGATALEAIARWMRKEGLTKIDAATGIMITPGFRFRIVGGMVTNFHQPKSTLLLLVSAFTQGRWRPIYDYALSHDFRFLSYGDSSLLLRSI